MKADRKNKKKFNDLKKITNAEQQSKEFGQLVDLRASDPVKVKMVLMSNQKTQEALAKKEKGIRRTSTLQKLTDNYFYKAFAQEENDQIIEESDED